MARFRKKENISDSQTIDNKSVSTFRNIKGKIKDWYADDMSVVRKVDKTQNATTTINNLSIETFNTNYYNLNNIALIRQYSNELYTFNPIYSNLIDYLSNMSLWRYTFTPRLVKEKANTDYKEIYNLMSEVVEGINVENTFPLIMTELFVNGAVFLTSVKNTASKTITTISLPAKYCRVDSITQFGTYTYQFDFSYFDSLGLSKVQLEEIFEFYPPEMKLKYNIYIKDKQKMKWQQLDSKFSAAILLNKYGISNKLKALTGIKQYEQYLDNELERNNQQLTKILTHKMPIYEDTLVLEMDEAKELHQTISTILKANKNLKLITTFGEIELLSVGEDSSKENKTLLNAYNAIFDANGENHNLFNADNKESLFYSLQRDFSIVSKYIKTLENYYNLVINNSFNFKGYQCDFNILPISIYNQQEMLNTYKEGATLGVNKLEYIIATGVKQINIGSKIELENFLELDKLTPLATSYTQNDNSQKEREEADKNKKDDKEKEDNTKEDIVEEEVE